MIKPLISVPVLLSGNVKIQCFSEIEADLKDPNLYWGTVRQARLVPLASNDRYGNVSCNLLTSDYSYDLAKYYKIYSNTFFSTGSDEDLSEFLPTSDVPRPNYNTDFCWGCKRVSYQKNLGATHTFFAPFWSTDEVPDEFILTVRVGSKTKKARFLLSEDLVPNSEKKHNNYLPTYLARYSAHLDAQVLRLDYDNQCAWVSGIDLEKGGVSTAKNTTAKRIWHYQQTVNGFDYTLASAFQRSKRVAKQIVPLAFSFDLSDLLNSNERLQSDIRVSGEYSKNGTTLEFYRFSENYSDFKFKYTDLVTSYNASTEQNVSYLKFFKTGESPFEASETNLPGDFNLREGSVKQYKNHLQKFVPYYFRWQLCGSQEDRPYYMNLSNTYSLQQYTKERLGYYYDNPLIVNSFTSFLQNNSLTYADEYEFQQKYQSIFPPFLKVINAEAGETSSQVLAKRYGLSESSPTYQDRFALLKKQSEIYQKYFQCFTNQWFAPAFYRDQKSEEDNLQISDNGTFKVKTGLTQEIDDSGMVMYKGILYDLSDVVKEYGAKTFRVELDFKKPYSGYDVTGPVYSLSRSQNSPSSVIYGRTHYEQTYGLPWNDISDDMPETYARMKIDSGNYVTPVTSKEEYEKLKDNVNIDRIPIQSVGVALPYPFMFDTPVAEKTIYQQFNEYDRLSSLDLTKLEQGYNKKESLTQGLELSDITKANSIGGGGKIEKFLEMYEYVFIGSQNDVPDSVSQNFFEIPYISQFGSEYIKYIEYTNPDKNNGALWKYSQIPNEDGEVFLRVLRTQDSSKFKADSSAAYYYKRPGRKCDISDILLDKYDNDGIQDSRTVQGDVTNMLRAVKVKYQLPIHRKTIRYVETTKQLQNRVKARYAYWRYNPAVVAEYPELLQFALQLNRFPESSVKSGLNVFCLKYRGTESKDLGSVFGKTCEEKTLEAKLYVSTE